MTDAPRLVTQGTLRLERSWTLTSWALVLAAASGGAIAYGASSTSGLGDQLLITGFSCAPVAAALLFFSLAGRAHDNSRSRTIVVNDRGLWLDDSLLAVSDAIERGLLVETERAWSIHIAVRDMASEIVLTVSDEDTGRALLSALDLDAHQVVAHFRVGSRAQAHAAATLGVWIAFLGFLLATSLHAPLLQYLALGALLLLVLLRSIPARLTVGLDGLALTWLGRTTWLRHRDIDHMAVTTAGNRRVLSYRVAGKTLSVPLSIGWSAPRALAEARRICQRIEDARARGLSVSKFSETVRKELERPVVGTQLVHHLQRASAAGAADHRHTPLDRQVLLEIATCAAEPPRLRIRAAVALSGHLDDDERDRLLESSRATAERELATALELIAEHEATAADLTEALARIDGEAGQAIPPVASGKQSA